MIPHVNMKKTTLEVEASEDIASGTTECDGKDEGNEEGEGVEMVRWNLLLPEHLVLVNIVLCHRRSPDETSN